MNFLPKNFMKIAFSLLMGMTSNAAFSANIWSSDLKVTSTVASEGSFLVTFNAELSPKCTNIMGTNTAYIYQQSWTDPSQSFGARNMVAAALAAHATGKKVKIYFDDSTTSCRILFFQTN